MINLDDGQKDQVRALAREGKKVKEIKEFFKTTYSIDLNSGYIYYTIKGRAAMKKSKPQKLSAGIRTAEEDPSQIVKEIKELIDGLHAAYIDILRTIRADLIRARARLQEKKEE